MSAGARVATVAGRTVLDRKGPEAAQFDPVALGHRVGDFAEDRVDDVLNVALIKVWIGTRACLQLGGLCARTDQNQTRNIVLLCSAAGTLGIHKSVAQ